MLVVEVSSQSTMETKQCQSGRDGFVADSALVAVFKQEYIARVLVPEYKYRVMRSRYSPSRKRYVGLAINRSSDMEQI